MFAEYLENNADRNRAASELRYLIRSWQDATIPRCPEDKDVLVVNIPGYLAADKTTSRMRWFLDKFGYKTKASGIQTTMDLTPRNIQEAEACLAQTLRETPEETEVFLIGHSAGGIIARGLAKKFAERTSGVINLGSIFDLQGGPSIGGVPTQEAIDYFKGQMAAEDFDHYIQNLDDMGGTPNASIYSNNDEFLPTGFSKSSDPNVEHIELNKSYASNARNKGPSHMGLICSLSTIEQIAGVIHRRL